MRLFHKETTASTNLDARAGVHGDVFSADFQTAGRGRLDHRWESMRGCNVMFSAVLSVAGMAPGDVATFPLVVGHVLATCVAYFAPKAHVQVKWPNDVWIDGRKTAGILCERAGDLLIAGVGLNVNQCAFPEALSSRATSLALACGAPLDVAHVRDVVLADLFEAYGTWREKGFAGFHGALAARDALKGRTVAIRQTDGDGAPVKGLCAGIQEDGSLKVGDTAVYAGEAHVLL